MGKEEPYENSAIFPPGLVARRADGEENKGQGKYFFFNIGDNKAYLYIDRNKYFLEMGL